MSGAPSDRARADALAGARAAYARWFAALEAGDVAGGLAALTPDVELRVPSGDARVGHDAVRAALTAFHAVYAERVAWELTLVAARDGEAEVRVREETVVHPRTAEGGPSVHVGGWHAGLVRREPDGVWRIARDVGTIDGPPEALSE